MLPPDTPTVINTAPQTPVQVPSPNVNSVGRRGERYLRSRSPFSKRRTTCTQNQVIYASLRGHILDNFICEPFHLLHTRQINNIILSHQSRMCEIGFP